MSNGTVSLYDKEGVFVNERLYNSPKHRKEVIAYWKKIYGQRVDECIIHIYVNCNINQVKKNGENFNPPASQYYKRHPKR